MTDKELTKEQEDEILAEAFEQEWLNIDTETSLTDVEYLITGE